MRGEQFHVEDNSSIRCQTEVYYLIEIIEKGVRETR